MAMTTTNYGLTKPETTDNYDIEVQNGNMDKIDTELKKAENHRNNTAAHVTQAEHDSIASAIQGATIAGKPIIKDGAILKIDALPIYNHGYTPTDADTCFEIGIHRCASWTNVPIVFDSQGTLIVLPYAPWPTSSAEGWQEQIYLPINGVGGLPGTIYKRKLNQSSYSSWINIADGGHAASADFASGSTTQDSNPVKIQETAPSDTTALWAW